MDPVASPPAAASAPVDPVAAARAERRNLSFRTRRGRVSPSQQEAIDTGWADFGLDITGEPLDVAALFGRSAPLILDIGFGMGDVPAAMAAADPDRDLIAVDVHTPGIGNLLRHLQETGLPNVRVAEGDAVILLRDMLGPASLDEVRVYFPDPWPKRSHHKRRLLDEWFMALVATRLVPNGVLHVATDWVAYAEQTVAAVQAESGLVLESVRVDDRPAHRPLTKFERLGIEAGHRVTDVIARRVG